jgi:hypothetical protein
LDLESNFSHDLREQSEKEMEKGIMDEGNRRRDNTAQALARSGPTDTSLQEDWRV